MDADGHAAGSSYSRADCRRHYLVKVFDVLHLNGDDLVHASFPLLERKALLETAFRPIPKFVELAESTLVDLHAQVSVMTQMAPLITLTREHPRRLACTARGDPRRIWQGTSGSP